MKPLNRTQTISQLRIRLQCAKQSYLEKQRDPEKCAQSLSIIKQCKAKLAAMGVSE